MVQPEGWKLVQRESWSTEELLSAMEGESDSGDRILFVQGDEPLLQPSITKRLLELQSEYRTEYTFADGYPEGLAPEVIDPSILPVLRSFNQERPEKPGRDIIFRLIQHDINAFDLETAISPVDLRLLRASVTCDTRGNYLLCRRLLKAGISDEEAMLNRLPAERGLLRTLPAYFSLQVTNQLSQRVTYEPFYDRQKEQKPLQMSLQRFRELLSKIEEFAPESVISVGYRGEPALHPEIIEMIKEVEESASLTLYLETSGVGWSQEAVEALESMPLLRTTLIIFLDAAQEGPYRELRGDGFREAYDFANRMRRRHPEKSYVQATRLREYQESLEEFYKAWKEDNPIIQKYNHYCGELPDRRVTDLSPLHRFPCWHLQRDMTILADGTVVRCQEDIHLTDVRGNVFADSLETLWERGAPLFEEHAGETYPGICGSCDEYYTYNA
jgi:spiro-SPASM protein